MSSNNGNKKDIVKVPKVEIPEELSKRLANISKMASSESFSNMGSVLAKVSKSTQEINDLSEAMANIVEKANVSIKPPNYTTNLTTRIDTQEMARILMETESPQQEAARILKEQLEQDSKHHEENRDMSRELLLIAQRQLDAAVITAENTVYINQKLQGVLDEMSYILNSLGANFQRLEKSNGEVGEIMIELIEILKSKEDKRSQDRFKKLVEEKSPELLLQGVVAFLNILLSNTFK